jgi:hypothetical protein
MRYIVMHKVDPTMEAGGPPNKEIIKNMGQLVQGSIKSGVFENGAGLHRSALRARVEYSGGERTITRGPFTGKNEVIGSLAMIKAQSIDDAIETAGRFAKILGDVEIEIGPVVEPWDLGFMDRPAASEPGRFLLLQKSSAETERGVPPKPATQQALKALKKQMTEEGILLASENVAPTSKGSRLASGPKGKRSWTDGPFAESKELVAGFSILNLPSKQEVLAWADRYAEVLGENEVDVLELE